MKIRRKILPCLLLAAVMVLSAVSCDIMSVLEQASSGTSSAETTEPETVSAETTAPEPETTAEETTAEPETSAEETSEAATTEEETSAEETTTEEKTEAETTTEETTAEETTVEETTAEETTAEETTEAETTAEETTAEETTHVYTEEELAILESEKPIGWLDANNVGEVFNTAVKIWRWFNLDSIPMKEGFMDDGFHQQVDYVGINTYADLEKYVYNYFSQEIGEAMLGQRSDYVDIDGVLCGVEASRGAHAGYGNITGGYFRFTSFNTADYTVTVETVDESGTVTGNENFVFKLEMDNRTHWHFIEFPIWM